jgi:hypothetical protein
MNALSSPISVVNVGLAGFADELRAQGVPVAQVDWRPPAGGDAGLIDILSRLYTPEVEAANAETLRRLTGSRPLWIDVAPAITAIPGMRPDHVLHSGPPIDFFDMCDPQQRAVEGAAVFEGWVNGRDELEAKIRSGAIKLASNYFFGSVGAMCGVITPSMQVIVTENEGAGNRSWSCFNEGKGNVIWMGTYDAGTIERLRFMRDVLGPALKKAVAASGGIDIFKLVSEGIQMGDEVHARSAACTMLLVRRLLPALLASDLDKASIARIVEFMGANNHTFLSLTLTACKVAADAAHGVEHSTVVTAMSRNGVDFALRAGGAGENWFIDKTMPMDEAIYYSGYGPEDAAGDIGDSAIVETAGLGGMIIGAAPSIASFVGGSMAHSRAAMESMRSICAGVNPAFSPASMDFTPAPTGVDVRKVVRLGLTPIIDTGVLHKASGVGQIGTGVARAPMSVFIRALRELGRRAGRA